jgi:hypothetical protein
VQPVGQLDQDDADVLHHGEQHLSEALGAHRLPDVVRGSAAEVVDHVHLGHALDELGDFRSELLPDGVDADVGILDHVVKQCGGHRLGIKLELVGDRGHRQGVADEGLSGCTKLALVSLTCQARGAGDEVHVGWAVRTGGHVQPCFDIAGLAVSLKQRLRGRGHHVSYPPVIAGALTTRSSNHPSVAAGSWTTSHLIITYQ